MASPPKEPPLEEPVFQPLQLPHRRLLVMDSLGDGLRIYMPAVCDARLASGYHSWTSSSKCGLRRPGVETRGGNPRFLRPYAL